MLIIQHKSNVLSMYKIRVSRSSRTAFFFKYRKMPSTFALEQVWSTVYYYLIVNKSRRLWVMSSILAFRFRRVGRSEVNGIVTS